MLLADLALPNPPLQRTWSSLTLGARPLNGRSLGGQIEKGIRCWRDCREPLGGFGCLYDTVNQEHVDPHGNHRVIFADRAR